MQAKVYQTTLACCAILFAAGCPASAGNKKDNVTEWWLQKPMRMIQTNLREIDATMDMDTYMQHIREYKADVVLFNVGGIVANYPTELPFQYRNPNLKGGGQEYQGLFRILAENHILFDVLSLSAIADRQTPRAMEDYPLVVLPDVRSLGEALCSRLDAYAANGGKILTTGMTATRDAQGNPLGAFGLKAAGVKEKYEMHGHKRGTYLRIGDEDKERLGGGMLKALDLVYLDSDFLECEPVGKTEGLLRFIPVGMYGPPEKCYYTEVTDIPGLFHSRSGKGACAFFPWQIGRHYQRRSNHGHSLLVSRAIDGLLGLERSVVVDTSGLVEVTRQVSNDGGFEWVGLVNHSGQNGTAFHKPIPISGIKLRLTPKKGVKRVRLLKAGEKVKFSVAKDGCIECVVPRLERFEIVLFEYSEK